MSTPQSFNEIKKKYDENAKNNFDAVRQELLSKEHPSPYIVVACVLIILWLLHVIMYNLNVRKFNGVWTDSNNQVFAIEVSSLSRRATMVDLNNKVLRSGIPIVGNSLCFLDYTAYLLGDSILIFDNETNSFVRSLKKISC